MDKLVQKPGRLGAISAWCPHDDGDIALALAQRSGRDAIRGQCKGRGHIAARDAKCLGAVLRIDRPRGEVPLAPVKTLRLKHGGRLQNRQRFVGKIAQDIRIRPGQAQFHIRADRRAVDDLLYPRFGPWKCGAGEGGKVVAQRRDGLEALGPDDKLTIGGIRLDGCVGQHEARDALAHGGRDGDDIRPGGKPCLDHGEVVGCLMDRTALPGIVVEVEERRLRRWKELLRHLAHRAETCDRAADQSSDDKPPNPKRAAHQCGVGPEERAVIGVLTLGQTAAFEEIAAKQRRDRHGQHPGQQKRDGDDREKREQEFARGIR